MTLHLDEKRDGKSLTFHQLDESPYFAFIFSLSPSLLPELISFFARSYPVPAPHNQRVTTTCISIAPNRLAAPVNVRYRILLGKGKEKIVFHPKGISIYSHDCEDISDCLSGEMIGFDLNNSSLLIGRDWGILIGRLLVSPAGKKNPEKPTPNGPSSKVEKSGVKGSISKPKSKLKGSISDPKSKLKGS